MDSDPILRVTVDMDEGTVVLPDRDRVRVDQTCEWTSGLEVGPDEVRSGFRRDYSLQQVRVDPEPPLVHLPITPVDAWTTLPMHKRDSRVEYSSVR